MKIICVIRGGILENIYSDSPNVVVDLLDYDNMNMADTDSEEYQGYVELEKEIEGNSLYSVY